MSAVDAESQPQTPDTVVPFDPRTAYVHSSMHSFEDGTRVDIPNMVRWLPKGQTIVAFLSDDLSDDLSDGEYAEMRDSGMDDGSVRLSAPLAAALPADAEVSTEARSFKDRQVIRVEVRRPE